MIFLGYNMAGDSSALSLPVTYRPRFTKVRVGGGIIDQLYISKDVIDGFTIPSEWNFDTILNAGFKGNLLAGNITFYVSSVDKMRLKRRLKGDLTWQTVHERAINKEEDFTFEWHDLTVRSRSEYEYTLVPVFGDVEGSFYTNSVETDFSGIFIMDSTGVYASELEVQISEARNKPRSIITTINRKYPYVIANGANDYDSGNISAYFVEKLNNPKDRVSDTYNTIGSHVYRRSLKNFLNNGVMKLLKIDDGRMWIIEVSSATVSDTEQGVQDFVTTAFDWVEVADCDKIEDLALTGLTEVT